MCGVLLLKRVYTFIHSTLHLFAHSTIQSKAANFKAEIKLENQSRDSGPQFRYRNLSQTARFRVITGITSRDHFDHVTNSLDLTRPVVPTLNWELSQIGGMNF